MLITGATSGIGRATAYKLGSAGYSLLLTGRRKDRLDEIRKDIDSKYDIEIGTLAFDIRERDACIAACKAITDKGVFVDILINNAGLAKGLCGISEGDWNQWDQMIDTNVKGLLYMTRLLSPAMVERGSGHIINVCSVAGHEVYPSGNVYSATKHAVDALTRSMRLDLCVHGIKVSQVSPGHVEDTEFASVRFDGDSQKADIYKDFNPLKSTDVAEAIFFIMDQPAHVNIQDITLFGTQQASAVHIDRSGRRYDVE